VNEYVDHLPDRRIPVLPNEVVQKCASQVGGVYDDRVNACVGHGLGKALLWHSMQKARHDGYGTSCTITLNGLKRAVRDDGEWTETNPPNAGNSVNDYVKEICHLAGKHCK